MADVCEEKERNSIEKVQLTFTVGEPSKLKIIMLHGHVADWKIFRKMRRSTVALLAFGQQESQRIFIVFSYSSMRSCFVRKRKEKVPTTTATFYYGELHPDILILNIDSTNDSAEKIWGIRRCLFLTSKTFANLFDTTNEEKARLVY